jgi:uncharacterized repeat protein (TIGR01451 family)
MYSQTGAIPVSVSVPENKNLLINIVNNDEVELNLPNNEKLTMVLSKDLSFKQSIEIYITGNEFASQNKKLDIFILTNTGGLQTDSTEALLIGNIDLPVFFNTNTQLSNSAYFWEKCSLDIDFNQPMILQQNSKLDIPISGFVTPLAGPVTFELGVIALDGDRETIGDQLQFNGAGTFVNISDALHNTNNFFNSMIAENGVITPFRNPNYSNSLGYDAGIFSPNNATYQYISNGASNATIRITTSSENILSRVITSAIDVYEPDIRASVRINDLNGGLVNPGDILEYTMVGKNIGSAFLVGTFMTDTLDPRVSYIPNTIQVTYGPNLGTKTDVTGDDQGEYIAADKVVKVRIGTGANAITGGQVNNSNSGADSTVIKFKVLVNSDCLIFECDNTLDNVAYIFGEGNISGNSYDNDGVSDELDANGCPLVASNELIINTTTCAPPSISSNGPVCPGTTLNLSSTISSTGVYNWTGPNGFTSVLQNPTIPNVTNAAAGTYYLSISNFLCYSQLVFAATIFKTITIERSKAE